LVIDEVPSAMPDALTLAVAALGVLLIAFMRGAFGGGFAIIGIPLLSLVMDPLAAGVVRACRAHWHPCRLAPARAPETAPRSASPKNCFT
jgi:hypothetical protein